MRLCPLKGLVVSGLLVFSSTTVYAKEFQTEGAIGFIDVGSDSYDSTTILLTGRYFLERIGTGNGPWYEADFLSHTSHVSASIGQVDATLGTVDGDGPILNLAYYHVIPGELITIEVGYISTDLDFNGVTAEGSEFSLTGGKFLRPEMWVGATYESGTTTFGGSDSDQTTFGVSYKQIMKLQGSQSANIDAMLQSESNDNGVDKTTNTIIEAGADYYIDEKMGIGGSLNINSGDAAGDEGNTIEIRGSMFFTPQVVAELSYSSFSASDTAQGEDSTSLFLTVGGRF